MSNYTLALASQIADPTRKDIQESFRKFKFA
jgi:hypothetical protein